MKAEHIKIHTNKQSLVEASYISEFSDMEFCDPTDDAFDDEVIDPENHLRKNEDIFTDEYMQDFAKKMDAKIAGEKRVNRLISVIVIFGGIIMMALFSLYAYYRYIN